MNSSGLFQLLFAGELRRAGHLMGLVVALTVGTALLWAIMVVSARINTVLTEHNAELFGGDLRISAARPLDNWLAELPSNLTPQGQTVSLPTMIRHGEVMRLVRLKAVDPGCPLLGELRVVGLGAVGPPPTGEVWVGPGLTRQLGVTVGETLSVGRSQLRIAGIIEREPDSIASGFSLGPRVLLRGTDLPATGLAGPGSRISYRVSFLDPGGALAEQLKPLVPAWARLSSAAEELDQTRLLLQKSSDFLAVLLFSALLLCAVTVALAVQGLLSERLREMAVLGLLGVRQGTQIRLFFLLFMALGLVAVLVGGGLGELMQRSVVASMGELLPPAGWLPRLTSVGAMLGLLLLFSLPPLVWVARSTPKKLLSGERGRPRLTTVDWLGGCLLISMVLVLFWQAGSLRFSLAIALLVITALFLLARFLLALLGRLPAPLEPRLALLGLSRSPIRSSIALCGLTLAVVALLLPLLLRADFIDQLVRQVPEQGPDRYLIDIQRSQRLAVSALLAGTLNSAPAMHSVYRARLISIDGVTAEALARRGGRARTYAQRENNLTEHSAMDPVSWVGPTEVSGGATDPPLVAVSVEQGWADALGVQLGSVLAFNVAGQPFSARVSAFRQVDWGSMQINFFLLFPPDTLGQFSHTYITAYHGSSNGLVPELEQRLVTQFPNVSVLDVSQIVGDLRDMVEQLSQALLILAMALPVIGAALLWTLLLTDRRQLAREALLLRLLGTANGQLRRIYLWRYGLMGAIAATIGGGIAYAGGSYLSRSMFEMAYRPDLWVLCSLLGGVVLMTLLLGYGTARVVLNSSPAKLLRDRPS